jgi:pimeloyl-ACP methyl ester carboxylesterase
MAVYPSVPDHRTKGKQLATERVVKLGNGRSLGFVEYGRPEGVPVFALHGTPGSRLAFEFADMRAQQAGIRLIAVDRPGIGISPKRKKWTILDFASDLSSLADELEIRSFGVVAWSGGVPYALAIAYRFPARVLGTACCSGVAPIDSPKDLQGLSGGDRLAYRLARRAPWLVGGILRSYAWLAKVRPKAALDSFEKSISETDRAALRRLNKSPAETMAYLVEAFRQGPRGVVQDYRNLADSFGFRLEEIAVPVHFWHGDADTVVAKAHFDSMTQATAQAVPHFCPGEGHLLIFDHIEHALTVASGRGGAS